MEKCKRHIMRQVMSTGFALYDAVLYLDTHPACPSGLAYYEQMRQLNQQAREQYIQNIGPLTVADAASDCQWKWTELPWPWELEGC